MYLKLVVAAMLAIPGLIAACSTGSPAPAVSQPPAWSAALTALPAEFRIGHCQRLVFKEAQDSCLAQIAAR